LLELEKLKEQIARKYLCEPAKIGSPIKSKQKHSDAFGRCTLKGKSFVCDIKGCNKQTMDTFTSIRNLIYRGEITGRVFGNEEKKIVYQVPLCEEHLKAIQDHISIIVEIGRSQRGRTYDDDDDDD
jgi:hypothetical protein